VRAAAAGLVTRAGRWEKYGNCIVIDHGLGVETRYAHLSRMRVSPGDFVAANAFIGAVGDTGRTTGPHLHFEMRHDGVPIDPMRAFVDRPPPPPEPADLRQLLDSWRRRHELRRILRPQS
jgi:murein DD-endopeptidase MepM/ murein hydrolase activator NlpD